MQVLSVKEVAERLRCSPVTIYRLIKRDAGPPFFRIGSDYRFIAEEVDRWAKTKSAAAAE